jgi:hypothetical protein
MRPYKIFGWVDIAFGVLALVGVLTEPPDSLGLLGSALFVVSGIVILTLVDKIEGRE